jgi:folate-binding protein YgfZ
MKINILKNRSIIEISGDDAYKFLQAITSNDLELAKINGILYTYFLNPQGRFLFDAFIYYEKSKFLLDVDKDYSKKLSDRLSFYKLNSKVEVKENPSLSVLYSDEKIDSLFSFRDPRYPKLGFRTIIDSENLQNIYISEGDLYNEDKYKYCIADGFLDLIPEKSLPPEFECEALNAVSYNKGCYTGQEVISRAKYVGEVRKTIYLLSFDEDQEILEEENFSEVFQDEVKIGKVTSYWNKKAIALLRKDLADKSKPCILNGYKANIFDPCWRN